MKRASNTARRPWGRLVALLLAAALASCAPNYTLVTTGPGQAARDPSFPYRKWVRPDVEPDTVVIALHGFCGASIDYENLAGHLLREQPRTAVYAYELRGQGRDPVKERRGDIDDPDNWSRDLHAFTQLVRGEHPDATLVWFGESMGALILSNTYRRDVLAGRQPPCDAIGLTSPVVKFRDDFPQWKKGLVRGAAKVAPGARVTLDALSGGQDVQMTADSFHSEQSQTNSWHVEEHTLRLLAALGDMIDEMDDCAETFAVPTLVLHGGQDFFTSASDVEAFVGHIPDETPSRRRFYPEGHHLLMYDTVNEEMFDDVADWLDGLGGK
jgi:acylglycerol lipase